uniref:winged helix-turn-helix domain-containing tetratricopeptide repeat protein n=1 Tax=Ensifer adhaerens TaxID=106592 RepID=UPI003F4905E2
MVMVGSSATATLVVNDKVVVDLNEETLRRDNGDAIVLRPQAFAVLRHLVQNANRLVSKAELLEAVWTGTAVTDDSLVQCIHEIRRALGDEQHTVLATVSRRGYRLSLARGEENILEGPSIAVLPFATMSGGQSNAYFADGLVEDIITNLSKIPGLFVIARNSSFGFRGKNGDLRTIAAELRVRYLLQGSLRQSAGRLRINAQLVDGASATNVWADRFEGAETDVFDLQDRLTEQIVGSIEPSVRRAEIERARRKRPESLDAYDLYLRALPHAHANTPVETDKALQLLARSIELQPDYVPSHGYAAWCYEQRYLRNGLNPADKAAALRHADIALGINSDDPQAMSIGAFVRANLTRDYDAAIEVLDRALALNNNSALAFGFSALVSAHSERHQRAVEHAHNALRLSPLDDPLNYHPYCALALTHLFTGAFADAARYAALAVRANPGFSIPYAYLAASHVGLGNVEAAHSAARRLIEVSPNFSVGGYVRTNLFRAYLMDALAAALRTAGLPE